MADAAAFAFLCNELESASNLSRLEARGTMRLALKDAGLEAHSVTRDQMCVVVEKLLGSELQCRGIENIDYLCHSLLAGLAALSDDLADGGRYQSAEDVFKRLRGGR